MSNLGGALRHPSSFPDEAIERHLTALLFHLEPDPLFRRRLRSEAVNRFVAVREGIPLMVADRDARSSVMGKLGRACLYASFTLGVSAASVLAASQEALPGEALYGLKLRIEHVRMEVLPGHLHEQLATYALTERIDEMARLADAGHLAQAMAMAPQVEAGLEELMAAQESTDAAAATKGIESQLLVLDALIERLPEDARSAVENAIKDVPGLHLGRDGQPVQANGYALGHADPKVTGVGANAALDSGTSAPDAHATPELTTRPARTAKPEPTSSATQSADGLDAGEDGAAVPDAAPGG